MKRKIIAIVLGLAFALTVAGCNPSGGNAEPSEIDFWSTYATEKVLQDKPDLYDDVRLSAEINVDALKGEYESAL